MGQPFTWVYDQAGTGIAAGKRHKMELPGPDNDDIKRNHTHPEYVYQEFPKHLNDAEGNPIKDKLGNPLVANSTDEEKSVLEKHRKDQDNKPKPGRGPGRPRKELAEGETDDKDDPTDIPADEQSRTGRL